MLWRILLFVFIAVAVYNSYLKVLPPGVNVAGTFHGINESEIVFLTDETYVDGAGDRVSDQKIFSAVFKLIEGAQEYILLDMFLFNAYQGAQPEDERALSTELVDLLVAKRNSNPEIKIVVVTDPINTVYSGVRHAGLEKLRDAGIGIILTDLKPLRDSNVIYSPFWRIFVQWFGNTEEGGFLKHPFDAKGRLVSVRSWLALLNFKANHRKLIVADASAPAGGRTLRSMVMSANPHDASSAHENIAFMIDGSVAYDLIGSEQAVGEWSGTTIADTTVDLVQATGSVQVRMLTEKAIRNALITAIDQTGEGDSIDMVMFYISDRPIIRAIKRALDRGVVLHAVFDPNRDAFGFEKDGVPNRQVAHELVSHKPDAVSVRWCNTSGEQCHSKVVAVRINNQVRVFGGSANLTRRNIGGYNLETNIEIRASRDSEVVRGVYDYIQRISENANGRTYTVPYENFADEGLIKRVRYLIQEVSGLSTF